MRLLKRGVRDLTTITDGLDGGSAAVIEAMLRVILRHEALTVITSMPPTSGLDADILPELGPPLHRQISLGTSARNSMERLRDRLADDAMYKKILKFLIKTLQNIQSDQSNIEYRRIIKESKAVIDMVISNPEVVSVLLSVGFVEEEHLFRLVRLHRDGIIRGVNVLRDLAAEVGIELLY